MIKTKGLSVRGEEWWLYIDLAGEALPRNKSIHASLIEWFTSKRQSRMLRDVGEQLVLCLPAQASLDIV